MIVGTGLVARAFAQHADVLGDVCVYAAGVSNSACTDVREFERERQRLDATFAAIPDSSLFVYFSTCSVEDPAEQYSSYVQHKRIMETRVRNRNRYLILRLPQLAGATPNPHTLLNFLYARIVRSERFSVWRGATRNIIDVDDVARIACDLLLVEHVNGETINIANIAGSPILDIVAAMERATGHRAIFDIIERGSGYAIDVARSAAARLRCAVNFDAGYLERTLRKYYASHDSTP